VIVLAARSTSSRPQADQLDGLRAALADRATDLALHLLGEPNRALSGKAEWRYGSHGSLAITVAGAKAGLWFDHETGEGSDMLALIMRERRCGFAEAVRYAREFCGMTRPRAAARPYNRGMKSPDYRSHTADRDDGTRIQTALHIFASAGSVDHPVARRYLERRKLILPDGVDGRVLRFSARCPFGPSEYHPAIIALYRGILDDEPRAISRIALTAEGEKIDRKMLGPVGGTACKLTADEDVELGLHICEGIETGLAAMALGFVPLWALGSAGAITNFPLFEGDPDDLGFELTLTIVCDNDPPNPTTGRRPGQDAARACAERWTLAGQEVRVVTPALLGDDANDVLKRRGQAHA
jgi:hypothetical protein